jgi:DNA-directed RNA polymerase subunit L
MELKYLEKGSDHARIKFESVDEAIVHLFITELLKNNDVKEATYSKMSIEESNHAVFVRMRKGRPTTAMKKAAENLSKEFSQGMDAIKKKKKMKSAAK